jgi:Flp pilus assembly protein TadD
MTASDLSPSQGARRSGGATGWKRVELAALVLGTLLLVPAASAQDAPPDPPPKKGRTVLMIPPAPGVRPPEVKAEDEYVLNGGLDRRAPEKLYRREGDAMQGYRSVLTMLSTGQAQDAMESLYAFETSFMEGREPKEIELLFAAEVEVIRVLGQRDIESIVPVLMLHHDAYPMYLDRRMPQLAGHSSRIAASLADLYAREGGTEGSRVLGARALTSLGIFAQQSGVKLQGLGLMLHALDFDPTNEAALLGIATVHERSGNYHRAAERLQELLAIDPDHREGRLRMALNLDRLGSPDQARHVLSELIAEPGTDWVTDLAYQEVARIHRQADRLESAEQVLLQGVERFPRDGRMRTQLAFVLDRLRKPQEALRVIEGIGDGDASREPSARRLYGMGPQEAYREVVAGLRESSSARMPRLARLVNGTVGDRPAG